MCKRSRERENVVGCTRQLRIKYIFIYWHKVNGLDFEFELILEIIGKIPDLSRPAGSNSYITQLKVN